MYPNYFCRSQTQTTESRVMLETLNFATKPTSFLAPRGVLVAEENSDPKKHAKKTNSVLPELVRIKETAKKHQ